MVSQPRKRVRRQPSKDFGDYLRKLRRDKTGLKQADAARSIHLNPEQLNYFERGRRVPPDSVLIDLARLYRVPPEDILRKAYWPQLILLPLIALIDTDQIAAGLIAEIEKGLFEAERQDLTKHIERMLLRRKEPARS